MDSLLSISMCATGKYKIKNNLGDASPTTQHSVSKGAFSVSSPIQRDKTNIVVCRQYKQKSRNNSYQICWSCSAWAHSFNVSTHLGTLL